MLTLHFDYTSPASALAVLRLQQLADRGADVEFIGIDALGLEVAVPATLDQLDELERFAPRARQLGLVMHRPRLRPPTLSAHLVAGLAQRCDLGAAWRRAVLEGYWTRGLDLSRDEVLVEFAGGIGLSREQVGRWLADRARRIELRQTMTAERGRGVGGVPVLEFEGAFVSADLDDDDLGRLAAL